jgi:membrane-associated protein
MAEIFSLIYQFFLSLIDVILHIDQYLAMWSQMLGPWLYLIVFLIVFAETGVVVTPFLPGDSLLFALGALVVIQPELDFTVLSFILLLATFVGDNTNYFFGKYLGPKVFKYKEAKFFNVQHLHKTKAFYDKHGSRAVIIARFIPIVRTFVPFIAGVGHMNYRRFLGYSFAGAVLWTQIFLWAGRIFGNLPAIKSNFHVVIFAVIGISLLPLLIAYLKAKRQTASNF